MRFPCDTLTFLIRDDSPMFHANDDPTFRTVRIILTPDQLEFLRLKERESVSRCFVEPETPNDQGDK